MEKKIICALDDSACSRHAVRYIGKIMEQIGDLKIVLFTIQQPVSQYLEEEAKSNAKARAALNKLHKKQIREAEEVLIAHKDSLLDSSIEEERIEIKTMPMIKGVAEDILNYSTEGMYDALCVGRRGISGIAKLFTGSVTANIISHAKGIPVWVVDGDVKQENFLLSVDGSENSFQALDHFTYVFKEAKPKKIYIYHAVPVMGEYKSISDDDIGLDIEEIIEKGQKERVKNFTNLAMEKLAKAGIEKNGFEFIDGGRVMNLGKAVIEASKQYQCGTIIMGRRSQKESTFMGSVSRYVLANAEDKAVWVCT